jgi:ParB family chromosome partitioning protein
MLGKSRSSVANGLRLLTLESEIQDMLHRNELSRGHAKALLGLPPGKARIRLARLCQRRGLSVRECEARVQATLAGRPHRKSKRRSRPEAPEVRALRERTEQKFGSPVRIERDPRTGKGTLTIRFYSDEDLERVLEIMGVDTDLS